MQEATMKMMVGLGRLELPTSRLSSARSNQLSYKPEPQLGHRIGKTNATTSGQGLSASASHDRKTVSQQPHGLVREERETKAAKSRKMAF
jgi:hypothetical protein